MDHVLALDEYLLLYQSFTKFGRYDGKHLEFKDHLCGQAMGSFAYVEVMFGAPTLVSTVRDARTSLTDKISSLGTAILNWENYITLFIVIGGTLGLFTGMSLLSIFEVAFWLGIIISRLQCFKSLKRKYKIRRVRKHRSIKSNCI